MVLKSFRQRLVWVRVFFLLIVGTVLARALYLQVIDRSRFETIASRQGQSTVAIKLRRGPVFDANGDILAVSLPLDSVFAIPHEVENPVRTAELLSRHLRIQAAQIESKLTSDISFTWLKRNAKPAVSEELKQLSLPGIHFLKEYQRFYPMKNHASHVLGFSGIDSQGLEGIEYWFNSHLMDNSGFSSLWNILYGKPNVTNLSGGSIYLTLQSRLQFFTEKELRKAVEGTAAKYGTAIIMETSTGKVLALANMPDYDPNNFDQYDSYRYFNRAVNGTYEPGSTFKLITVSAALDSNSVEKESIFYCEEGDYQIQDRVIHDVAKYGWLPLEKIVQKSSNICAAKIGQRIPKSIFYKYIREFGFGTATGIELPGEVSGKVHNYQNWSDTDVATISFGHTVAATPIQLVTAVNAIANGGRLIKPRIIQTALKGDGTEVFHKHRKSRQVISSETADLVKSFMESVIQPEGTGFLARIEGVSLAGKTGTSRKFDLRKREYSKINHISSFVGFFPSEKPLLTILVVIDEPQQEYLGSKGAAPVFRKIAEHALRFYPETLEQKRDDLHSDQTPSTLFERGFQAAEASKNDRQVTAAFKGLTMREALVLADELDLKISLKGSGKVQQVVPISSTNKEYTLYFR